MIDAVAAEWWKLRSVRSTLAVLGTVGAFALLCAVWSWYAARYWDGLSATRRATFRSAPPEQPLSIVLPVCAVVLGALPLTSEYASGMIRTSLAAMPRRPVLFAAKAGVAGALMLVSGLVAVAVGSLAGRAVVGDRPMSAFHGAPGAVAAHLLWLGLSTAAITLMTFGLGAVLRSTAGTISVALAVLMVLPGIAQLLPAPWDQRVWSVLPGDLATEVARAPGASEGYGVLPAPAAVALLIGYVVAALAAGGYVFARRDA